MTGTLGREVISTRQRKIAELARREPKLTLTTLAHHIDEVWMREAYRRTRKDAAAGDILVVGTVSFEGLTRTVLEIAERMPVTAVVNDIAGPGISAKTGVSWTIMGSSIGEYMARQHPKESAPVKVAWFPGPEGSGWVPFVEAGFRQALRESSADIVVTKYGDTGREVQLILLEEALEERPDVDYIVGSAVTAEVAVSALRARGLLTVHALDANSVGECASRARVVGSDKNPCRLLHPCGLPRHQAPPYSGRAHGLPGDSGSSRHRAGGTAARRQARPHSSWTSDKARGSRQRGRARHRNIPRSGLVYPEVYRRIAFLHVAGNPPRTPVPRRRSERGTLRRGPVDKPRLNEKHAD